MVENSFAIVYTPLCRDTKNSFDINEFGSQIDFFKSNYGVIAMERVVSTITPPPPIEFQCDPLESRQSTYSAYKQHFNRLKKDEKCIEYSSTLDSYQFPANSFLLDFNNVRIVYYVLAMLFCLHSLTTTSVYLILQNTIALKEIL